MHSPIRRYAAAFAISTALLVASCSGDSGQGAADATKPPDEVFLQPVAAQGPDPFTDSTATATDTTDATPPVTRTPQPPPTGSPTPQGVRGIEGGTPGLYGGTYSVASCDVDQQARLLTSDQDKSRAFADAAGIEPSGIAGWLRGLAPVQVRADTRVTSHGYRDGRPTSFPSVLQTGTAVLVDDRGLPRVRCACGNPLSPPTAVRGDATHRGQPWDGYHPTRTVVITRAPQVITTIIIVNITDNIWIERRIGDDGRDDRVVPPPPSPDPSLDPGASPDDGSPSPDESEGTASPDESDSASPNETDGSPSPDETDTPTPGDTPGDPPGDTPTDCPSVLPTTPSPAPSLSPLPSGCPTPPPADPADPADPGTEGDEDTPTAPTAPNVPTAPDDLDAPDESTDLEVFDT
ncbi:DUF6777 domain-containing protein [Streptomyces apocyni]|uniref:DUF6777 domain-containing protein n=1 Tax=Streptomyces apocyni TaxID=2654677 RepID=UPI0012EA4CE9|nr:DUF6777 domain-containing protein [Streptomyces apocyni]